MEAVEHAKIKYELNPGEGAFYGPKLEFVLTDAIEGLAMWNFANGLCFTRKTGCHIY